MSNRCSRCQASIPSGRNYCTAHYMEVLADYETALAAYHQDMAIWNSMSPAAQAAAHVNAEDSSISSYSGLVGFIIGAIVWYVLAQSQKIDALVGLGILAISVAVFTAIKPIRILVGRLARLSLHAAGYFIGLWIVGAIISIWSPFIKENSSTLTSVLAIGVVILSAYLEATGGHHASGRPTMPTKPSP
jgi:hypothetical protein